MAIFTGNWLDDDGVPFDPSAKVNEHYATSGSACLNRTGQVPRRGRARFAAAIRYSAHRWHHDLPPWAQEAWALEGEAGPSRRGTLDRTPTNGFVMFNAFDFLQLWAEPPSIVVGPSSTPRTFLSSVITDVNLGDQTVTLEVNADVQIPNWLHARFATFQVDPAHVRDSVPWRHTRLIDLAQAEDFDPLPYVATVPLAWPVAAGELLRLYFRGRVASWWKYHAEHSVTP